MAALFWRFILVVSWLFEDAISFLTSIQRAGWEGAGSAPQGCCIQPVSESRRLSYKHRNTETEHLCLKKRRDFDDTSGAAGSKNFICTFASFFKFFKLAKQKKTCQVLPSLLKHSKHDQHMQNRWHRFKEHRRF